MNTLSNKDAQTICEWWRALPGSLILDTIRMDSIPMVFVRMDPIPMLMRLLQAASERGRRQDGQ